MDSEQTICKSVDEILNEFDIWSVVQLWNVDLSLG
jgi:hypothetical protein